MKNFLETYKHIINTIVAFIAIAGLFYLGSTIIPEDIEHDEPTVEVKQVIIEQLPPEPVTVIEIVVEPEPVIEEIVKEVVEVEEIIDIDTSETEEEPYLKEVEIDSVKVKVDSTQINHVMTEHFEVTVSVDGYLIVPDSINNIVDALAYVAERIGSDATFVWKDSTYNKGN